MKKIKKYFLNKNKIIKSKFDYIILSPGIDAKKCNLHKYLLKNNDKIITELDIFIYVSKKIKNNFTGTNGKSTTCQDAYIFLDQKLDVRLVGNIGNPPLQEKKK